MYIIHNTNLKEKEKGKKRGMLDLELMKGLGLQLVGKGQMLVHTLFHSDPMHLFIYSYFSHLFSPSPSPLAFLSL